MSRGKRRAPEWVDAAAAAAFRLALAIPNVAGLWASIDAASHLGRLFALAPFNRKRLARADEHLIQAFPDWGRARRRDCAIRSYQHLFTLAVELAFAPRLLNEDSWPDHVDIVGVQTGHDDPTSVRGALAEMLKGRPCILITGHCGNWEVLGYSLALLGFPMHALYRPLDNAALDRWVRQVRGRRGLTLVDKFGAAGTLPALLASGTPTAFVADQNAGDRGLFVPYFGRLASTYKTIGLLAMQFEAPIACGIARRTPLRGRLSGTSGLQYRVEVHDVITPEAWRGHPHPLYYITARYRRALESMVRTAPEQYLWMHRMWKSRPPHERRGRPMPAFLVEQLRSLPWLGEAEIDAIVERSRRDAAEAGQR